jgi:hypothetical protein
MGVWLYASSSSRRAAYLSVITECVKSKECGVTQHELEFPDHSAGPGTCRICEIVVMEEYHVSGMCNGCLEDRALLPDRYRDQIYRRIMALYQSYLATFQQTRFIEFLWGRYGKDSICLMTLEELEDLVGFMTKQLKEAA